MENMDAEISRPYAVVLFPEEGNTLSVVPKSWLTPTNQRDIHICKWPPSNVKKASKKNNPPAEEWATCKAKLIHSSRTYKNGNEFLEKYMYSSEVDAASSGPENIKRKRAGSTNKEQSNKKQKMGTSNPLESTNSVSKADFNRLEAKVDNAIQNLFEVMSLMSSIQNQLTNLKSFEKGEILDVKVDDFKRLESIGELRDFEVKLLNEEEFLKGVKRCGYLGGRDYKEAVRRILQKIFSHDTALELTWNITSSNTTSSKTSIQDFPNVLLFITVSLRSNPPYEKIPQSDVENVMKRWFRYASDRNGGRVERMMKKKTSS